MKKTKAAPINTARTHAILARWSLDKEGAVDGIGGGRDEVYSDALPVFRSQEVA
jgi:hypothetical protein